LILNNKHIYLLPMAGERTLTAVALKRKLPCAEYCQFDNNCPQKFIEGVCAERIDRYVEAGVYGTPSEKTVRINRHLDSVVRGKPGEKPVRTYRFVPEICFETKDPAGEVRISDGWAFISRPYHF